LTFRGVRVQKTDSSGTVKFVYDGSNVLGELDGAGNLITAYTHGLSGLVSLRRAAGPRYYHFDGLGSTTELTDATQAVTNSYRYEAFGNLTAQAGNTRNAYRYVGSLGYYADADSGLMLLGARYYASAVGQFLTQGPLEYVGGYTPAPPSMPHCMNLMVQLSQIAAGLPPGMSHGAWCQQLNNTLYQFLHDCQGVTYPPMPQPGRPPWPIAPPYYPGWGWIPGYWTWWYHCHSHPMPQPPQLGPGGPGWGYGPGPGGPGWGYGPGPGGPGWGYGPGPGGPGWSHPLPDEPGLGDATNPWGVLPSFPSWLCVLVCERYTSLTFFECSVLCTSGSLHDPNPWPF